MRPRIARRWLVESLFSPPNCCRHGSWGRSMMHSGALLEWATCCAVFRSCAHLRPGDCGNAYHPPRWLGVGVRGIGPAAWQGRTPVPCLSQRCAAPFFARVPICGRAIAAMLIARDDGLAFGCWAWGIGPVAGQGRTPVPCLSGRCAAPFFARVPTCGRAIAAMLTSRDDGLALGRGGSPPLRGKDVLRCLA